MVKLMEGDWVRVNSVSVKEFDGMKIYFKPSDDGKQIIGIITELPATVHGEFNRGDLTRSPQLKLGDSGRNEDWFTHERHLRPTRLCPNEVRFLMNFNL